MFWVLWICPEDLAEQLFQIGLTEPLWFHWKAFIGSCCTCVRDHHPAESQWVPKESAEIRCLYLSWKMSQSCPPRLKWQCHAEQWLLSRILPTQVPPTPIIQLVLWHNTWNFTWTWRNSHIRNIPSLWNHARWYPSPVKGSPPSSTD